MSTKKRANILFLFTDMQRYDSLGCNGSICKTPAIDEIASQGMNFKKAYTPIALCSPARGSVITGLYPHNHGQLANLGNFNSVFDRQILDKKGYPELLSKAGYNVSYVGKWHLPKNSDTDFWGFDKWPTSWYKELQEAGIEWDFARDEVQRLEWGADAPFCGRSNLPADKMQEYWVADQAIEMIKEYKDSDQPFMINVNFFGPHFPYSIPEPYDTMYNPEDIEQWGNFKEQFINKPLVQQKEILRWNASHLTWPDWQKVIAHYWGYCTFIDDQVKRITDCLDECDMADNTVIVYTTDHGDMLGSHRIFNKGMQMYEETHHIPMVISWPGVIEPASICNEFVSLVDLMPTFLEVGNTEIPEEVEGRSLLPLFKGKKPEDWPDDVYAEFHGYEPALNSIRMVRTDKWKYIYNPCSQDELYDLETDPDELYNLADKIAFKHIKRRMKARLLNWLRKTNDSIADENTWQSDSYDLFISKREE